MWGIVVFQIMNGTAGFMVGLIVEQCAGFLNGYESPEQACEFVVLGILIEMCSWQMEVTYSAEFLFTNGKTAAADLTRTGNNGIKERNSHLLNTILGLVFVVNVVDVAGEALLDETDGEATAHGKLDEFHVLLVLAVCLY